MYKDWQENYVICTECSRKTRMDRCYTKYMQIQIMYNANASHAPIYHHDCSSSGLSGHA